jgi:hypothetical protein
MCRHRSQIIVSVWDELVAAGRIGHWRLRFAEIGLSIEMCFAIPSAFFIET